MKKILFILALTALAATSNAQFVVSVQLGGSYSLGSVTPTSTFVGINPATLSDTTYIVPSDTLTLANPLNLTGGFKFGYQTGRLQFGIAASFTWSHYRSDMGPNEFNQNSIVPDHRNPILAIPGRPLDNYVGWYTQHQSSFTISPYLRYEVIQAGDIAFFLELDGFYTHTFQPIRHDYADWECVELHNTIDTTYHIKDSSYSMGAKIIPGMSWQLTPHCYIDLYFDMLSLSYEHNVHKTTTIFEEYTAASGTPTLAQTTVTNTTVTTNNFGFLVAGINSLNPINQNWVRIGFSYTF